MPANFLPAAQHRAQPWKNGLGVSHTIADFPRGAAFDAVLWQVGSTGIVADCPFSDLPGLDRLFMVIEGAGVELTCVDEAGATTRNRIDARFVPFAFRGDWRTSCRLLDGSVRVFNVMTRRGRFAATVEIVSSDAVLKPNKNAGETQVAVDLATLDTWLLEGTAEKSFEIGRKGELALVRISTQSR